jgi:hypothetical protein
MAQETFQENVGYLTFWYMFRPGPEAPFLVSKRLEVVMFDQTFLLSIRIRGVFRYCQMKQHSDPAAGRSEDTPSRLKGMYESGLRLSNNNWTVFGLAFHKVIR